jgi:transposase
MTTSQDDGDAVGCADEELMTRRQVAYRFGVASATVAGWARRGALREVREDGKPRYRRADVEELARIRSGGGGTRRWSAGPGMRAPGG